MFAIGKLKNKCRSGLNAASDCKKLFLSLGVLTLLQLTALGVSQAHANFGAVYVAGGSDSADVLNQSGVCINPLPCEDARYLLYPTGRYRYYLQLDTQTGEIRKLKWNSKEKKSYIRKITEALVTGDAAVRGRFQLMPTTSDEKFLLQDRVAGTMYFVDWKKETVFAIPVKEVPDPDEDKDED